MSSFRGGGGGAVVASAHGSHNDLTQLGGRDEERRNVDLFGPVAQAHHLCFGSATTSTNVVDCMGSNDVTGRKWSDVGPIAHVGIHKAPILVHPELGTSVSLPSHSSPGLAIHTTTVGSCFLTRINLLR